MTHESFKDIVTFYEEITLEQVSKFLDGETVSHEILLEKWFDIWKTGKFRAIFDEIKELNKTYFESRRNDTSFSIPTDAEKPRDSANKNNEKFQKAKTRRGKFVS